MDGMDRRLINILQGSIPPTENPYLTLGERLGIPEEEVVRRLNALKDSGKLKRIGAILRHQKSGYGANAMVVFQMPEESVEKLGARLAESPLVSHCYERSACKGWTYTLYAMIHGKTEEEIEVFVHEFTEKNGVERFKILYSQEELKKTSMVYFPETFLSDDTP